MSRNTEVGIISCGTAAVTAPILRIVDQGLVLLLVAEMKTLRQNIAQVIRVHPRVALCMTKSCI